ncbi:MAG: FAD-dependent oxidoreductase [Legionellaceae bacterium]|nr:FAD-dependent oxidoreductase [Legionellaceae bacterium]
MSKIGIIGAGIAGCTTAIELANKGHEVTLFERTDNLLRQSSDATSHCFSVGFYHSDIAVAKVSLDACIRLLRHLKEQMDVPFQERERVNGIDRIAYVISTQSVISPENVISHFEALKSHYATLVRQDVRNRVLGPVDAFYNIADKQHFATLLDVDNIALIIETCDGLFDWHALKNHVIAKLHSHANITIQFHANVTAIQYPVVEEDSLKTSMLMDDGQCYVFDYIVNAAWRNAERLNQTAGFYSVESLSNKISALAIVQLPKELHNRSFFFGYNNLIFLTSGEDGIGYLTYSPVSFNIEFPGYTAQREEDKVMLSMEEPTNKIIIGDNIIAGATRYIPALSQCVLRDLKVGVIRASDSTMLQANEGLNLLRQYKGVRPIALGLITNEARQHTFWNDNAQEVSRLIDKQIQIKTMVMMFVRLVVEGLPQQVQNKQLLFILLSHFSVLLVDDEKTQLNCNIQSELARYSIFCANKFEINAQIERRNLCFQS